MKYVVTFQDNSRKNYLDLSSLCDNLDDLDGLNCFDYFSDAYQYIEGDFYGLWAETNEAVRISLAS
jgi:hypothetical protein